MQIPAQWRAVSFSTLKPLASWLKDLTARVEFLRGWLHDGPPTAFPLAYFFFPQVRSKPHPCTPSSTTLWLGLGPSAPRAHAPTYVYVA